MSKLTIGIVCYDDWDGVYFTLQSLRMHHAEVMADVEFLILDNSPSGPHGQEVQKLTTNWIKPHQALRYVPLTNNRGTATRDLIFTLAETEYVMVMDCHVLLVPGALKRLLEFFRSGADAGNLLQGPMMMDDLKHFHTHFDLSHWGAGMWGKWATDERGAKIDSEPFEIPAQGLGLFACRRSAWLGFNPKFKGFGGEEGYLHTKYKQHGRMTLCLPFLRWLHRFARPGGVPYPLHFEDRIRNYLIGYCELKMDPAPIAAHFKELLGEAEWARVWEKLRPEFTPRCTPMPVAESVP